MSTTAPEYLATLRDGVTEAVQQWMDQSTTAWDQWSRAWAPATDVATGWFVSPPTPSAGGARRRGAHGPGHEGGHAHDHRHDDHGHDDHRHDNHHEGCGCGSRTGGCGCGAQARCECADPCRCCVPDADVVVHARVGEVRVVPFHLRNPWRRERPVSLAVGPWHRCDGDDLTIRAVLEEESLVLAGCEDRVVRLLLAVRPADAKESSGGTDPAQGTAPGDDPRADPAAADPAGMAREAVFGSVRVEGQGRVVGDVERCSTAYADVRFEGCSRPQRVAVVVLPAGCDAVEVGCDCGCCC